MASCLGPYATKEIADRLDCCRSNTSRKMQQLRDRTISALLAMPERWAASGRPDRIRRAIIEYLRAVGRLAEEADVGKKFEAWLDGAIAERLDGGGEGGSDDRGGDRV